MIQIPWVAATNGSTSQSPTCNPTSLTPSPSSISPSLTRCSIMAWLQLYTHSARIEECRMWRTVGRGLERISLIEKVRYRDRNLGSTTTFWLLPFLLHMRKINCSLRIHILTPTKNWRIISAIRPIDTPNSSPDLPLEGQSQKGRLSA